MAVKTPANRTSPLSRGSGGALWLGGLAVLAVALPIGSSLLGAFERVVHWGKLVHGVDGFLVAVLTGLAVLGWRNRTAIDLTDQLAVLLTMFSTILFNVMWEIITFVQDWVRYSDLQKSDSDTMTNLVWGDVGAVVGALLAARLYCHTLSAGQRSEIGGVAAWLLDGPSRVLERHGLLVSIVVALLAAAAIAVLWFAGRPLPGFALD